MPSVDELILFGCSILFLVHPIHTEVVANIKSRDEILCLLFVLLSLYGLHRHLLNKSSIILLVGSAIAFALAMLSKENGVTILAIIPLSIYFFREEKLKKIAIYTLPYLVVVILFFAIRSKIVSIQGSGSDKEIINNILFGATNWQELSATTISILGKYIQLLVIPDPLAWDYSYNQIPLVTWKSVSAIFWLLVQLGLLIYAIVKLTKRKVFSFLIFFHFITLSVVSNIFFLSGSAFGERFAFMPSIGFCVAVPLLLSRIRLGGNAPGNSKIVGLGAVALISIAFGFLTFSRNEVWRNNYTLFLSGIEDAPDSWRTHMSLAYESNTLAKDTTDAEAKQLLFLQAEKEYWKSLDIYPENGYVYYNLGELYSNMGALDKARDAFAESLKMDPENQDAAGKLGWIYFQENNLDEAKRYFRDFLRKDSMKVDVLLNLGTVYYRQNRFDSAKLYFAKVLAINPDHSDALNNMGAIYLLGKDYVKAEEVFKKILVKDPNNASGWANLGVLQQEKGDLQSAFKSYEKALDLNPSNVNVYNNIINLSRQTGDEAKAQLYEEKRASIGP
jgi:tetratricopeptide (TPR) repeat protein